MTLGENIADAGGLKLAFNVSVYTTYILGMLYIFIIPFHSLPYTIAYHTIPYHTIPYHTIPYHIIPYNTLPYHTIRYDTTPTQE
jgi:hypothetical protein